jgi:hypothetical protein
VGVGTEEYLELIEAIAETPPEKLSKRALHCDAAFEFDAGFDAIQDYMDWLKAVCSKHRGNYRRKLGSP